MLEVQNVSKSYRLPGQKAIPVLEDVSLSVASGEHVAIIGRSGAGKTTAMRMLSLILSGILADDFFTSSIQISSRDDGMSTLTLASLFSSLLTSVRNQLPHAIRRLFLYRYSPCSS